MKTMSHLKQTNKHSDVEDPEIIYMDEETENDIRVRDIAEAGATDTCMSQTDDTTNAEAGAEDNVVEAGANL